MKRFRILAFFSLLFSSTSFGQLPNGSIAPDFYLSDLNGNSHHLYQYLDEGKVVFVKFFACHCPNCWAYHNTETLRNLYNAYGPEGTDQVRVLMIEHDPYNGDAFYGMGGYTQGNWTANNPIPMIDAEGTDRGVFEDYDMNFYPLVYKICPDKTTEVMSTSFSWSTLYQKADECPGTLGVEETSGEEIFFDQDAQVLRLAHFEAPVDVKVFSMSGREVGSYAQVANGELPLGGHPSGLYLVQVQSAGEISTLKILLP